MKYQFYTCDVFTDSRFGGNPLAVILDADGLSTEQMQLIAREFNYSETTFVLPPEQGHTCKVRIFTRSSELPFAGHPNIGTAFTLATVGRLGEIETEAEAVFEEKAGLVPMTIRKAPGMPIWSELRAPETLTLGKTADPERIAAVLSLDLAEIVCDVHLPRLASVGLAFTTVQLKDRSALERIKINTDALAALRDDGFSPGIFTYVLSNDAFDVRTRMFAPLGGTIEDPATGSANCALAGLLAHYQAAADGQFSWRIAQGVEMGRPSVLDARAEKVNGDVTGVWIAGTCVMISEGQIDVSP